MLFRKVLFTAAFVAISTSAEARVFSFASEYLGAYFGGSGSLSSLGQDAFANSSGGATVSGENDILLTAELGFLMRFQQAMTLRISAEVYSPWNQDDITGKNSSGQEVFALDSSVFVFNPRAILEVTITPMAQSRLYWFGGVGLATVTLENTYTMTTQGTSDYGLSTFTEKGSQSGLSYELGVGYEYLFVDTTTMSIDLGYRMLSVTGFEADSDFTSFQGSVTEGTKLLNTDGSERSLSLGGIFVGVTFRFYFGEL